MSSCCGGGGDKDKKGPATGSPSNQQGQEDLAGQVETGGLSPFKPLDHVISRVVGKVEDSIRTKANELSKGGVAVVFFEKDKPLEILGYRSNIVNGFMYFAKIKTHHGSFIQAKILETPQGVITLQSVTETKTDGEEREYFKFPKK